MARQKVTPGAAPARNATTDACAALVVAAGGGDTAALEQLLLQAQDVAWRFSMSVCGRAPDAEDAMQEALIRTYRHVGSIEEPTSFRPWLYKTVKNICLMQRRKRVHEPARVESLDDHGPDGEARRGLDVPAADRNPEELAANAGLRRRLQTALDALPAPFRAVVFLRDVEGLSTREVATVLGISEDNVKTRLHRARAQLKTALKPRTLPRAVRTKAVREARELLGH